MSLEIRAVRGMHDLFGEPLLKRKFVEQNVELLLTNFGYREIRTPVLEHIDVFSQAVGPETDIVEKQMYQIQERAPEGSSGGASKGETLVMRPEATSSVVRAILEHNLHRNPGAQRFYYNLPMFRYERPQKGRLRQFHQIGAELIGDASPEADAEVIIVLAHILKAFGLKEYRFRINSLGSDKSRPAYRQALKEYFTAHKSKLCPECQGRLERAPMRILDCKNEACKKIAAGAPRMVDHLDSESQAHFERVQQRLKSVNVDFELDPGIVRGLDYYSRTAFEVTSSSLGAQDAIGGGGRYDELATRFGEKAFPAVGWALGVERLMLALEAEKRDSTPELNPFYFFAPLGEKAFDLLFELSIKLKRAGVQVDMAYEKDKKLSWQMKQADRAKALYTLLLGDDELASGNAAIKEMATGKQETVALADLEKQLKNLFVQRTRG